MRSIVQLPDPLAAMRQTPNGTILGQVNTGNRFEVDGQVYAGWVHVKVAGIGVGYIHQDYVRYD